MWTRSSVNLASTATSCASEGSEILTYSGVQQPSKVRTTTYHALALRHTDAHNVALVLRVHASENNYILHTSYLFTTQQCNIPW